MTLITQNKKKIMFRAAAIIAWLLIWQAAAMIVGRPLILPSPLRTVEALFELAATGVFWRAAGGSFLHISLGFVLGTLLGIGFAAAAYAAKPLREFFAPAMSFLKAVPVVSFILILYFAITVRSFLPPVICMTVVMPVIYTNVLAGLDSTDSKLLEMAKLYRVSPKKRFLYIYISNVMPHFVSGCRIALGLCWKSGVAVEVIGMVSGTIGERMYYSQLWLQTDGLFALTFVIIAISAAFEFFVLSLLKYFKRRIER